MLNDLQERLSLAGWLVDVTSLGNEIRRSWTAVSRFVVVLLLDRCGVVVIVAATTTAITTTATTSLRGIAVGQRVLPSLGEALLRTALLWLSRPQAFGIAGLAVGAQSTLLIGNGVHLDLAPQLLAPATVARLRGLADP